jgi:hypothetical protein
MKTEDESLDNEKQNEDAAMNIERILCSAIWYKSQQHLPSVYEVINAPTGVVLCGYRHHKIIGQCLSLTGKSQVEMGESVEGFLTSKNRFLNRKDAAKLHIQNGGKLTYSDSELFSEDLY